MADPPTADNPGSRAHEGVDSSGGHPDCASASGRLHETVAALGAIAVAAEGLKAN
ncbi:MAG: hypothetical protein ABIJ53_02940 [Verrucomicrobiota bacterium]